MNIKDFGLTPQDAAVRKEYKVYIKSVRGGLIDTTTPADQTIDTIRAEYSGWQTADGSRKLTATDFEKMKHTAGLTVVKSPSECKYDSVAWDKLVYWLDFKSSGITQEQAIQLMKMNRMATAMACTSGLGLVADSTGNITGIISELDYVARFNLNKGKKIPTAAAYQNQLAAYTKGLMAYENAKNELIKNKYDVIVANTAVLELNSCKPYSGTNPAHKGCIVFGARIYQKGTVCGLANIFGPEDLKEKYVLADGREITDDIVQKIMHTDFSKNRLFVKYKPVRGLVSPLPVRKSKGKEYIEVYVHLLNGKPYRQSLPAYSLTENDIRKVFAHDKHAAESAIAERKSLSVAPNR